MKKTLITISSLRKTAFAIALGACSLFGYQATANTITPSYAGGPAAGFITYNASFSSGELHPGDGFTIYDIGGYTGVAIPAPGGWVVGGGPFGPPIGSDGPEANVTFTWGGPIIESLLEITYLGFMIGTTSTTLVVDDWASVDHTIGTIGGPFDGVLSPVTQGTIAVPAPVPGVPDGGATVALLGAALMGLAALRRKLTV